MSAGHHRHSALGCKKNIFVFKLNEVAPLSKNIQVRVESQIFISYLYLYLSL